MNYGIFKGKPFDLVIQGKIACRAFTEGDLQFGLSLMSYLGEGNISISPLNIRVALALLLEGATGETAQQIIDATKLPSDADKRHVGYKELMSHFSNIDPSYIIKVANGLWVDNKFSLNSDFRNRLMEIYCAEVKLANFAQNAENERTAINEWVSLKTAEKIQSFFPEGSINSLTVFVLACALYFKGAWMEKFNPAYTQKQDFTLSSGEIVKVDMMRKGQIEGGFPDFQYAYSAFAEVKAVWLPYKNSDLTNIIILPDKGVNIRDWESYLKNKKLSFQDLVANLHPGMAKFSKLEIPRHELTLRFDLVRPLAQIGIDRIFSDDKAELASIGKAQFPLYVSSAIHQTYFKTNEEGSEAAAATGIEGSVRGGHIPPIVEFIADRPFLELIVQSQTGAVLFLNRIEDPG